MSKQKITWIVLLILSIVMISFFGGALSYSIFFLLLFTPLISYIYILVVSLTFKIYQQMDNSDVVSGQMNDYYFILQNDMPFAFAGLKVILFPDNFEVVDVPTDMEYQLLPGEQFCFRTKLMCKYRGEYEVGVQSVIVWDFLHLFSWKYKLMSTYKVTARPKIVLVDKLKAMDEMIALLTIENQFGKNIPDVVTRDYMKGDSIRRIHWKATAKTGELKVRQYYDENKKSIVLFFDNKRYFEKLNKLLPFENKILETVIAITAYFAYQNISISVINKELREEVNNARSFEAFYEKAAGLVFDTDAEFIFEDSLESQIYFFVLHELTPEILENTQRLSDNGNFVIIYLVTDEDEKEFISYSNERRQIIRIGTEDDLNILL